MGSLPRERPAAGGPGKGAIWELLPSWLWVSLHRLVLGFLGDGAWLESGSLGTLRSRPSEAGRLQGGGCRWLRPTVRRARLRHLPRK